MSEKAQQHILCFIDAPDVDNLVAALALHRLNPGAVVQIVVTGRPVLLNASKKDPLWRWDLDSSRMVQTISAARIKNFLAKFGIRKTNVFDGGIAPRTLVPHYLHFPDHCGFGDVDPARAARHSQLKSQEALIKIILAQPEGSVPVAVGGPMTGLHQLIVRCPAVVKRFKELHAMFATGNNVSLMQFDDNPRGAVQFNVACDPQAAHAILKGLPCPIYLLPTEVTRVKGIGFGDAKKLRQALPSNAGTRELCRLYAIWYEAAVKPHQAANPDELIYIHDLAAAFSLDAGLRQAIYNVVPVEITSVPHLPNEESGWGTVVMKQVETPTNVFAANALTEGGAAAYLSALKRIFA